MASRPSRSGCPIASSLDILGDRWTLVVLRDLLNGKTRFGDLLASPERIATNVLTDRLTAMEAAGLVERRAYQQRPLRYAYAPTARAEALLPVLQQLCLWGNDWIPGTWIAPDTFMSRRPGQARPDA